MYETVLDLIAMGKKEIANDVLTVFYETYCKNTLVDETTPKLIKKISRMYNGLVNKKTDGPKPS
ncbi:MAG: hypothetical protein A3A89_02920 [Candidatus Magasanikbacteria bacterium RIFCSPLOWO2_01_FULL_33_34]|nr:MAG: hypothetical protein A3B83_02025 [Candidatus Magasanikbacteria bacterium RIFCSPHIGHO2_02_FULL_33_17]OGH75841.1 MAG: hypothetical protein A3A89_02920 [Candidatus Magasanikbacteria bacterium RIFCSPLOWO2_01_FULL_33_34]